MVACRLGSAPPAEEGRAGAIGEEIEHLRQLIVERHGDSHTAVGDKVHHGAEHQRDLVTAGAG
jgi:hypothetical protein